jgi:urea transport system ATP-binding protein
MSQPLLSIAGLEAFYGESRIVTGLDMVVEQGAVVGLLGRNGVGKSTTLKSIMGLVSTPTGSILFDGKEIIRTQSYDRARKGIGYVPQGREIFPKMTVQENLELGYRALGRKGAVPDFVFDLFPVLPQFAKRKGGDLSGGQQQQLAIARALVMQPRILILDEPTEGIQPSIIQNIGEAIKTINTELGITVLIVEQYLEFVLELSDYLYVMEKGGIVMEGPAAELEAADLQRVMTQ